MVRLEGLPAQTWLYKLEVTAPRTDLAAAGADQGFKVRRVVQNTDGSQEIKVGDLVKVTVFIEVKGRSLRYVVLDDPLPAGLMAVNTAFKTEEPLPKKTRPDYEDQGDLEGEPQSDIQGNGDYFEYYTPEGHIRFRPNFFEIREDRVLAFRDQVYSGTYRFEYYARAICEGTFVHPATKVAGMYSPDVNGYSAKGEITIKGR